MTSRAAATTESFDVREYARTARGSHRAEIDAEAIARAGLTGEAVRLIRVLRDVERGTLDRMRNLLVTATHKDARVTAFLATWAFEKYWVADALDAVLDAVGADTSPLTGPVRRTAAERAERRGPIRRALAGNIAGADVVAGHVTTGLVDELITQVAYRRLGEAAAALSSLVATLVAVKDRHVAFLAEEAERKLAASARAARLARREIARAAWPIGAASIPAADRSFFEAFVFGEPDGRAAAAAIGERLAALPGMGAASGATVTARLVP
ncbi:hypothetical protein H4J02_12800 [Protaetiibacter sp. SSC-01]|uniref:hypothetical protein n=1 Tax=Protaetiibacter sp. SSC-01 TaxID=2759943 RepID=UPI0016574EFE|nr:hypothetical protein [Protaetiibacter sp. SSC-01]QNO37296.1 hypothetical protein H4J02_12800 [Protaetiibacter sp. SSC-01]